MREREENQEVQKLTDYKKTGFKTHSFRPAPIIPSGNSRWANRGMEEKCAAL